MEGSRRWVEENPSAKIDVRLYGVHSRVRRRKKIFPRLLVTHDTESVRRTNTKLTQSVESGVDVENEVHVEDLVTDLDTKKLLGRSKDTISH
jgi:hypothetical protein